MIVQFQAMVELRVPQYPELMYRLTSFVQVAVWLFEAFFSQGKTRNQPTVGLRNTRSRSKMDISYFAAIVQC